MTDKQRRAIFKLAYMAEIDIVDLRNKAKALTGTRNISRLSDTQAAILTDWLREKNGIPNGMPLSLAKEIYR